MGAHFKLTVADLFKRSHFEEARVVAGKKGLGRLIRWVHIFEITETGQLLNGNELILSTGVGWRENEQLSRTFLKQLIERKVSGLCIELGTYVPEIPKDMIALAEAHDFPIIVFPNEVRFIDITQDINGLLMDTQYKMMSDLEQFSNRLNHLLLSTDGFKKILRLLNQYLNVQVIYVPVNGDTQFFPPVEEARRDKILTDIQSEDRAGSVASHPIEALGHRFADLYIYSKTGEWTEFDYLVLDRTATALAQDQMRLLYVEEKRESRENRWVQQWLRGEYKKEELLQHLQSAEPSIKPEGYAVCLYKLNLSNRQADFTYYSMIFRSIFEQNGFSPFILFERNLVICALVNKRKKADWKTRLHNALEQTQSTDLLKDATAGIVRFGIGKLFDEIDHLHESYQMAQEALYIQEKAGKSDTPFYEDLHVYRIISQLNQTGDMQDFVSDYLNPILEYDAKYNSQMVETLKVFLEVNGSKKEAAERLYIVRQTLYHRIKKLKELLGEDFMQPEKRLALEIALRAWEFSKQL